MIHPIRIPNPGKKPINQQSLINRVDNSIQTLKGIDRRHFLKKAVALTAGAASLLPATTLAKKAIANPKNLPPNIPDWQQKLGTGVVSNPYGVPSIYEKDVIRRTVPWLTADSISSISFSPIHKLNGIITPNGLVFERYHGGLPTIPPQDYRLMIHGLVDKPIIFTLDELKRFPAVSEIKFIECPANSGMEWRGPQMEAVQFSHGMISCCEWTGVRLSTLLDEAGINLKKGKWILVEGSDAAAMTRSIPIEKAMDDALVVYSQNGEALRPEQGYPVRLLIPGWEGNTSVKWLRRLKVGEKPWHHREETSKYTDLLPSGKARRFTWAMACKSIVTSPSPENPLNQQGYHYLTGLAWSGRGKIKKVDISFDGGNNWKTAEITSTILDKALTRFGLGFQWLGEPLLIQSRAKDETGYVQPTIAQLRAERGIQSIYHNHSIQTWKIDQKGKVYNVQIS